LTEEDRDDKRKMIPMGRGKTTV